MASKKQLLSSVLGDWTAAEISITYKNGCKIDTPTFRASDAKVLIHSLWDRQLINLQEQFMAFYFNRSSQLLGYRLISRGGVDSVSVNIKLIVSLALHSMAHSVIVAHNHPSGNTTPSDSDKGLTIQIKWALQLIDIKLLDHLIITENNILSFAQRKML